MIETARLVLRPYHPKALVALVDSVEAFEREAGVRAEPGLRDFFVSGEVPLAYLEGLRRAGGPNPWIYGLAAVHRGSESVIGNGGFKGEPDDAGAVEIAYAVVPSFQRQGYATEIADALVRFASADSRTRLLRAHTLPAENASTRVLAKLGFQFVGGVVDPEDGPIWRWERDPVKS